MQCQGDAGGALNQAGVTAAGSVPDKRAGEHGQPAGDAGWSRVRRRVPGCEQGSRPAVAERGAGELRELARVSQAGDHGVLGCPLAVMVAQSKSGELLGAGQAGRAIAP